MDKEQELGLILQTAEAGLQIVLVDFANTALLNYNYNPAPSQGAEVLVPSIQSMCKLNKVEAQKIKKIVCVQGPGSFTGIRLCLSTAAGLQRGSDALVAGIGLLPLLAFSTAQKLYMFSKEQEAYITVLSYARKNLIYKQSFCIKKDGYFNEIEEREELKVLSPEQALLSLRQDAEPQFILGSGLTKNKDFFAEHIQKQKYPHILLPTEYDLPSPFSMLLAAQSLNYSNQSIEPLYVRGSDAEENIIDTADLGNEESSKIKNRLAQLLQANPFRSLNQDK